MRCAQLTVVDNEHDRAPIEIAFAAFLWGGVPNTPASGWVRCVGRSRGVFRVALARWSAVRESAVRQADRSALAKRGILGINIRETRLVEMECTRLRVAQHSVDDDTGPRKALFWRAEAREPVRSNEKP
ncbi:hypothetical protein WT56_32620 [Burkholderia pseudomultivorans]|uniref:Uncharacterized protein n=1 Tax=Burkholderia pseudomultivorans TaxID=1207504 RepID=A0A132E831_9BURK|nr:hypothetical protein WT56_32620 [Burkholderia pseudomultivorans]